jgi:hypothetical protein
VVSICRLQQLTRQAPEQDFSPMIARGVEETHAPWPQLDGPGWSDTVASLTLWGQIIGKTRLALCPMMNHWWQVAFYVSARGLTTSPMPFEDRALEVELDFIDHRVVVRGSDGALETMDLCDGPLSAFYHRYVELIHRLGVDLPLYPYSVEMPERVRLDRDSRACRYDPAWANRFFRALVHADRLLKQFRARFGGKASPVHFFWGAFDLATTRFSGRPAPPHPGGIPNVGDWVMREAYSQEVSSAGFWPGDGRTSEAAFYSYAYPEPPGFKEAKVSPAAAAYQPTLGEFLLPYRDVRLARDPSAEVLEFLESTYAAAADLAQWDRSRLERRELGKLG